jgi:hypothetical protein
MQINVQFPATDSPVADIVILATLAEGDSLPSRLDRNRMMDVNRFIDRDRKLVCDPPADQSVGAQAILPIDSMLSGQTC